MKMNNDGVIVPYGFSAADAARYSSLSRTRIFELIKRGALPSARIDGRVVVLRDDLEKFLLARRIDVSTNSNPAR